VELVSLFVCLFVCLFVLSLVSYSVSQLPKAVHFKLLITQFDIL
jgi:hypothetical protein